MEDRKREQLLAEAGKQFKIIRESNGYTQEQLSHFLSVDRTLITKFESGERTLGVTLIEKACKLFGCETDVIFTQGEYKPLAVAYRAKDLEVDDMEAIAKIQQITLNLRRLKQCTGENYGNER